MSVLAFLRQLLGGRPAMGTLTDRLRGEGTFGIEVMHVSDHIRTIDIIWEATSTHWEHRDSPDGDFWEQTTDAKLISDPNTSRDSHPIHVEIAGKTVGSLSLADALRVHRRLVELECDRIDAQCKAKIAGRTGWWTVHLDFERELVDSTTTPSP